MCLHSSTKRNENNFLSYVSLKIYGLRYWTSLKVSCLEALESYVYNGLYGLMGALWWNFHIIIGCVWYYPLSILHTLVIRMFACRGSWPSTTELAFWNWFQYSVYCTKCFHRTEMRSSGTLVFALVKRHSGTPSFFPGRSGSIKLNNTIL